MTMERRKVKFLYEFLPENTFNHAETDLSGKVTTVHEDNDERGRSKASDLPDQYILHRIQRHATRWDNFSREQFAPENATIKTPGAANFEVYPRTFACGNCSTVNQFTRTEVTELSDADGQPVTCDRCSAPLRDYHQMQFVMVCPCGQLQEIYVPEHCGTGMAFRSPGVGFENAYWYCTAQDCSHTEEMLSASKCFNPHCDGSEIQIQPHSASKTFYPQTQTLINIQENLDTLHQNQKYQTRIVSDYLRTESGDTGPTQDEILDRAMELLGNDEADSSEEARELAKEQLTIDVEAHQEETAAFMSETIPENEQIKLAEELFEYLSVVDPDYDQGNQISTQTFDELRHDPSVATHLDTDTLDEYLKIRDQRSLSEVRLIKNFPITTVTYGYSRIYPSPTGYGSGVSMGTNQDEADEQTGQPDTTAALRLFNSGEWADTEVFARTTDAEAVMLSMDREAIISWLVENGLLDGEPAESTERWFLGNVAAPGRFERVDPDADPITRHCYSLLHTFSHAVVEAIGSLSGYGRDSLVEHLLPRHMSTVIYKRPDTDFSLGSIFTLFEERFDEVMARLDEADDCTYDVICNRDHNCACEDCLYLSTLTCQNTNHNLSRSTYFGGEFDGAEISGFASL